MGGRRPHGRIWSADGHLGLNLTGKEVLFSDLNSAWPQVNFEKVDLVTDSEGGHFPQIGHYMRWPGSYEAILGSIRP